MENINFRNSRGVLFLLIGIIVACQTNVYDGPLYVSDPNSRITLLEGGSHPGAFKTNDLSIQFGYVRNPGYVLLSGFVELAGRFKSNYDVLRFFYLNIHFLDSDGQLLQSYRVLNAWKFNWIDSRWKFERNLATPPGTTAIAFSYLGEVREAERDFDFFSIDSFRYNPLRRVPSN